MKRTISVFTLLMLSLLTISSLQAQQLEVRGQGELKAKPDVAVLHMQLKVVDMDFNAVMNNLNKKVNQITKHLVKAGFSKEQLKTSMYQISENTLWRNGTRIDSGYVGTQNLMVEVSTEEAELTKAINTLSESPVDSRISFSFKLSDEKQKTVQAEVIRLAIRDAKSKAELIADESGLKLVMVKDIKYGSSNIHPPVPMRMENFKVSADGAAAQFQVQDFNIQDEILVVWQLQNK
ncbi:SIMPL domain-containing protein [Rapidithrix thailandica]|uniref:SIMPL domain-containing protein n=1 Tax=Rapidithrix thailandica TaxID=413964 RepID=A0AAW9SCG9_9BACT